jgi:hypothetical protein
LHRRILSFDQRLPRIAVQSQIITVRIIPTQALPCLPSPCLHRVALVSSVPPRPCRSYPPSDTHLGPVSRRSLFPRDRSTATTLPLFRLLGLLVSSHLVCLLALDDALVSSPSTIRSAFGSSLTLPAYLVLFIWPCPDPSLAVTGRPCSSLDRTHDLQRNVCRVGDILILRLGSRLLDLLLLLLPIRI